MEPPDPLGEARLRHAIEAAEEERRRWARELHDETLQGLGALRLVLASGRRGDDPARLRGAVDAAVGQLEHEIDALRSLIRELRPAALDELGPGSAIEDLATWTAGRHGVEISTEVALDPDVRHATEIEVTLYRVIQEALGNAVEHAGADHIRVGVSQDDGVLRVGIVDDGRGFDPAAVTAGFGLARLRERVRLMGGTLEIVCSQAGTSVTARLPAQVLRA